MPVSLPYLASPGTIKTAFDRIKTAATPERFTQDFVHEKLNIKGGTGTAIPPFLKKIGFVKSDGTPSDIYHKFRNHITSGSAMAEALRIGYRELYDVNESCHELNDAELLSLITQVTGAARDSSTAKYTSASFRNLKSYADFTADSKPTEVVRQEAFTPPPPSSHFNPPPRGDGAVGLNLSYTINLNLPATADQAVFNAIFKSLKEHLLNGSG